MPSRATTSAAVLTSAPSSRARSASTGITAPCPMALTTEGPYAGEGDVAEAEVPRGRHPPILAATRPAAGHGAGAGRVVDRRISREADQPGM